MPVDTKPETVVEQIEPKPKQPEPEAMESDQIVESKSKPVIPASNQRAEMEMMRKRHQMIYEMYRNDSKERVQTMQPASSVAAGNRLPNPFKFYAK